MSKQQKKLTAIAESIRSLQGTTEKIVANDFAATIENNSTELELAEIKASAIKSTLGPYMRINVTPENPNKPVITT